MEGGPSFVLNYLKQLHRLPLKMLRNFCLFEMFRKRSGYSGEVDLKFKSNG